MLSIDNREKWKWGMDKFLDQSHTVHCHAGGGRGIILKIFNRKQILLEQPVPLLCTWHCRLSVPVLAAAGMRMVSVPRSSGVEISLNNSF